jgi:hypothetical protein
MPTSQITHKNKFGNNGSKQMRKRSNSSALSRGSVFGLESSGSKEHKVKILNSQLMKACKQLEEVYTEIFFSKKHSLTPKKDIGWYVSEYRLIWKHLAHIIMLLKLYKPVLGLSVNFAKGTPMFLKLKNLLGYSNNLIENLARQEFKGPGFSHLWDRSVLVYLQYLEVVKDIIGLNKAARTVYVSRMKSFAMSYQ